jgi:hypothetical protein
MDHSGPLVITLTYNRNIATGPALTHGDHGRWPRAHAWRGPMTAASCIRVELKTLSCKGPNQVEETHRTRTPNEDQRFISFSALSHRLILSSTRLPLPPEDCCSRPTAWSWRSGDDRLGIDQLSGGIFHLHLTLLVVAHNSPSRPCLAPTPGMLYCPRFESMI